MFSQKKKNEKDLQSKRRNPIHHDCRGLIDNLLPNLMSPDWFHIFYSQTKQQKKKDEMKNIQNYSKLNGIVVKINLTSVSISLAPHLKKMSKFYVKKQWSKANITRNWILIENQRSFKWIWISKS